MAIPRRGSLFWTLSASMLAVLLLAVLLQWLVAGLLVEPGLRKWHHTRSVLVAERLAAEVADALDRSAADSVPRLLAEHQRAIEPARLFVYTGAGRWIGAPGMPQGPGPAGDPNPLLNPSLNPQWSRRLDAARRAFESGEPSAPMPREAREVQAGRRGRGAAIPRFDLEFVASATVPGPVDRAATVYVAAPRVRLRLLAMLPRHAVVFVPVAVLVAALAGLLISHRLQRRIARLDDLATRIGRGEFDARIARPGGDELGHLGTRLNAMAAGLERSRAEVRELEQQRSQLLADISHDLVTPLTTIRGFAETLLDDQIETPPEDRRRYLHSVVQAAERMDRLLTDLLELARLEAQTEALERERLDLAALARNSVERFAPAFAQAGLELRYDSGLVPAWVEADGHRLEQVLDNLLVNALRHVPRAPGATGAPGDPGERGGGSRVEVRVEAAASTPGRVALVVEDDGPGIDAADLPHIFDRFYRADRARTTPGSGLGLAIAREIVDRHGGTIHATAHLQRGSRFVVELPAAVPV